MNPELTTINIGLTTINIGLSTMNVGLTTINIGLTTINIGLTTINIEPVLMNPEYTGDYNTFEKIMTGSSHCLESLGKSYLSHFLLVFCI